MTLPGPALLGATILALLVPAGAQAATTVTIPGGANLWLAGGNPAPGDGPGSPPPSVKVPKGATAFTVVKASGLVSCCSDAPNIPPDGGGSPTSITPTAGAIGPYRGPSNLALLGLFLDGMPTGDAPDDLGGDDSGEFGRVSPRPKQPFFIGNGHKAGGGGQTFRVPRGAGRLYLGLPDSYSFTGPPQKYEDNNGSFKAVLRWRKSPGRTIGGEVTLGCGGGGTCSRLPIKGVPITATRTDARGAAAARRFQATTDTAGKYRMTVPKGVYTVHGGGQLIVTPDARRVDLRERRRGTADFTACGFRGPRASAAAVGGGRWKGGDCRNKVEVSWRPSAKSLSITWESLPRCTDANDGEYFGQSEKLLASSTVQPRSPGHNLSVADDEVAFARPIGDPALGYGIAGKLKADGKGSASGTLERGNCTFATLDGGVPLRKQ